MRRGAVLGNLSVTIHPFRFRFDDRFVHNLHSKIPTSCLDRIRLSSNSKRQPRKQSEVIRTAGKADVDTRVQLHIRGHRVGCTGVKIRQVTVSRTNGRDTDILDISLKFVGENL